MDIGGTFTDIVALGSDGSISERKVSSTTDDYSRGIVTGLGELIEELGIQPSAISEIVHGTTVATNAILEGKGARTALITTEGFRDVLELRRIASPVLYNLFYQKPPSLVPRRRRFEVKERVSAAGRVGTQLDLTSVHAALDLVAASGSEALAVCLLNSYSNPDHERLIVQVARSRLPDVFVSCSVDVLPEIREYERTSTTVINAYVGPVVKRYLSALRCELDRIGVTAQLRVMQSNGGVMSAAAACDLPAQIVESGPAAGVTAAAALAKLIGLPNVITLDMGGTTAKAAMIEAGRVTQTTEYEVGGGINKSSLFAKGAGYALKLPVVDVSEIGAGGGSVVWIDKGGRLHIGPQSAGAEPGPVCYDMGGEVPTVTDANVVLGYVNPNYIAGGRVRLNSEKAARVLDEHIARQLKLSLLDTAFGVHQLASLRMTSAVKAVTTYRGRDPRDFVLVAFGGSGPVCAVAIARELGIRRILVPPAAGLYSALGLLLSEPGNQLVQTLMRPLSGEAAEAIDSTFAALEQKAVEALRSDGYTPDKVQIRRSADMRYAGQGFELTADVPSGRIQAEQIESMIESFEIEHERAYGHRSVGERVNLVNVRIAVSIPSYGGSSYEVDPLMLADATQSNAVPHERQAYWGPRIGSLKTPVLRRHDLGPAALKGPLVIEEYDATCVVPPGCSARLDQRGNIWIEVGEAHEPAN